MTNGGNEPLFQDLDIADQSAWDDSALIRAYELATKSHTVAKSNDSQRFGKRRRRNSHDLPNTSIFDTQASAGEDAIPNKLDSAQEKPTITPTKHCPEKSYIMVPPPPPALYGTQIPSDVEKLLIAWYEAGYRAGMYAAKMSVQCEHSVDDRRTEKGIQEKERVDGHNVGTLK